MGPLAAAAARLIERPTMATPLVDADLDRFTCPDSAGGPEAPCFRWPQKDHLGLEIELGARVHYCPVAEATRCAPYEEWLPFREQKLTQLALAAGVPHRLASASFATATPTDAIIRMQRYIETELVARRALLLLGPTGVGKTLAAVAGLRDYNTHRRRPGAFWFVPKLVGALLDPDERADTLDAVKTVRFLVLDDLGAEFAKEGGFVEALFDEIVWTREGQQLPTVITSNLPWDDFMTRFSARIVDRLAGEWGSIFEIAGPSLRRMPA